MSNQTKLSLHIHADDTREFKASRRLENALNAKMRVLVNKIKRTGEMSDHDRQLMRDAIRNSVQRVYVVGANYAANWLQKDFIMTSSDIENIKALSQEFGDRMQWRIDTYALNRSEDQPKITTDFITGTFAGYVAPRTLSVAVSKKSQQILLSSSPTIGIGIAQAAIGDITTTEEDFAPDFIDPTIGLVWVTAMDDRVCPICMDLEGSTWDVNDPDVPAPDEDTHPNCRCMLRLMELP